MPLALKAFRSSRLRGVPRKMFSENFEKLIGKHLCRDLFVNKSACLSSATQVLTQLFNLNFAKFLKTPVFITHWSGSIRSAEKP